MHTYTQSSLNGLLMLAGMLFFSLNSAAQYTLSADYNNPRGGDKIVKQRVEYKDPGRNGEGVLWDFGSLNVLDQGYTVDYMELPEHPGYLVATEREAMFHYFAAADSALFQLRFENPLQRMDFSRPGRVLRYPFGFGEVFCDSVVGQGAYCNLNQTEHYSTVRTSMDAAGLLVLPGGDTLKRVVRVRSEKLMYGVRALLPDSLTRLIADSVLRYESGDTLRMCVESFRWFAWGYRYPVFESERMYWLRDGERSDFFCSSFVYPPERHSYLEDDPLNLALLEQTEGPEVVDPGGPSVDWRPGEVFAYNLFPNPVRDVLQVEFFLPAEGTVGYSLLDMGGQVLIRRERVAYAAGIHRVPLDMSGLATGGYTLILTADDKPYSQVVIKRN